MLEYKHIKMSKFINEELHLLAEDVSTDTRPVLRHLKKLLDRPKKERIATKEEVEGMMKVEKLVEEKEEEIDEKLVDVKKSLDNNHFFLKFTFAIIVFPCLYHHSTVYSVWEKAAKKSRDLRFFLDFTCNVLSGVMLMAVLYLIDFIPRHCAEVHRERQERYNKEHGIVVVEKEEEKEKIRPVEMTLGELTQRQKEIIKNMMEELEPKKEDCARYSRQFHFIDMLTQLTFVAYLAARMFISYRAVWQLCTIWDATNAAIFTSIMIDAWRSFRFAKNLFFTTTEMATTRIVNGVMKLVF